MIDERTNMDVALAWTGQSLAGNRVLARYEPLQPFVFLEMNARFGVQDFFDVGANTGFYSLLLSRLPSMERVYAFEPSPSSFRELQENIRINSATNISSFNSALSSSDGEATFGVAADLAGTNSILSTSIHGADRFTRTETVTTARLDSLVSVSGRVVSFKIDVEGHEHEVLKGAESLLANNTVILQVEVYDRPAVHEFLVEHGFAHLFHVGPDHYYLKGDGLAPAEIVRMLEKSFERVIAFTKGAAAKAPPFVRRRILPGMTVELSGWPARQLRRMKRRLA